MSMELLLAAGAAFVSAAVAILHFVAPLTKSKKDDLVLSVLEKVKEQLPQK